MTDLPVPQQQVPHATEASADGNPFVHVPPAYDAILLYGFVCGDFPSAAAGLEP